MCPGATGTTYQVSQAGTANTEDRTRVTSSLRHFVTLSPHHAQRHVPKRVSLGDTTARVATIASRVRPCPGRC